MKKIGLLLMIIAATLILNGCGLALLAAGTGYAIGQGRKGEAEKITARGEAYKQYQEVRLQYIKENAERVKQGLEPVQIPEYEEWMNIVADKKIRKKTDLETKKDQITGKKEIQDLKTDIQNTKK